MEKCFNGLINDIYCFNGDCCLVYCFCYNKMFQFQILVLLSDLLQIECYKDEFNGFK